MSSRTKRLKINIACFGCRSRKVRCDGVRPVCGNCQKKNHLKDQCIYSTASASTISTISYHDQQGNAAPANSSSSESKRRNDVLHHTPTVFATAFKAAIDVKLGLPASERPNLIPMSDAPLFGSLHHGVAQSNFNNTDNVLPQRKHADFLVNTYWHYIQSIEPFLDQEQFSVSYQALFAGEEFVSNERIFISTLNTVFALASQLQENVEASERDGVSNAYFQRAWTLLQPEAIIWELASLELVQCLLLMGRYLQCTNNSHQTWMVIGSAVRIAQSLNLHMPSSNSTTSGVEARIERQVWQCCVFMDRQISWVLGKSSTLCLPTYAVELEPFHDNHQQIISSVHYLTKMSQLYEISNRIMLGQIAVSSSLTDGLGLPRLYMDQEDAGNAVQLDMCLNNWEKSLPQSLRSGSSQSKEDEVLQRQRVMLRLRLLHARIHLFRPMLARLCFGKEDKSTPSALEECLKDRVSRECAILCVTNAQKMVDLVHEHHRNSSNPRLGICVIPWWYRIFYFHVASTILIAASLRHDLFTLKVSESWDKVMMALHEHEHLSPFITQCIAMFQALKKKIVEMDHGRVAPDNIIPNTYFQDVIHDMGFDPDNFLFGKEDISWLSNFESTL